MQPLEEHKFIHNGYINLRTLQKGEINSVTYYNVVPFLAIRLQRLSVDHSAPHASNMRKLINISYSKGSLQNESFHELDLYAICRPLKEKGENQRDIIKGLQ